MQTFCPPTSQTYVLKKVCWFHWEPEWRVCVHHYYSLLSHNYVKVCIRIFKQRYIRYHKDTYLVLFQSCYFLFTSPIQNHGRDCRRILKKVVFTCESMSINTDVCPSQILSQILSQISSQVSTQPLLFHTDRVLFVWV